MAAGALAAFLPMLTAGADAIDLHRTVRGWPSEVVLPLALAAALAFEHRRAVRYLAAPIAVIGVVAGFAGSTVFLDRFGHDPFLAPAVAVSVKTIAGPALNEFSVPFDVSDLRVSSSGRYVALLSTHDDEDLTTVHAGRAGGPYTELAADEAVFVDEARLLLLARQRSGTTLRLVSLENDSHELWTRRLPDLFATRLWFDEGTASWRLLGWNDEHDIVSAVGDLDGGVIREQRWTSPARGRDNIDLVAVSGSNALAIETDYVPGFLSRTRLWRWAPLVVPATQTESRLWMVRPQGSVAFATSRLDVRCEGVALDDSRVICTAFDGTRTRFFGVDPEAQRLTALMKLDGRFYQRIDAGRGWVTGWWASGAVAIDVKRREAIRVEVPDGGRVLHLTVARRLLAAVSSADVGSSVRFYSLKSRVGSEAAPQSAENWNGRRGDF